MVFIRGQDALAPTGLWAALWVVRGQDALAPGCSRSYRVCFCGEVFDGGGVEWGALFGVDVPGAVVEGKELA